MSPLKSFLAGLLMAVWILPAQGAGLSSAPGGADWIGYRGSNGFAVYPDSTLPLRAKEPAWRVPVPSWGFGQPIVVGDKVIVLAEPNADCAFVRMVCYAAADGKELWSCILDHSSQLGADGAVSVKAWTTFLNKIGEARQAVYTIAKGDKAAGEAKLKALDIAYTPARQPLRQAKFGKGWKDLKKQAAKGGFFAETWWLSFAYQIDCVGYAFATPVSDGTHVYASTGYDAAFCVDLQGNLVWSHFERSPYRIESTDCARSPLIYGDLLIVDIGGLLRALDRKTGKVLWQHPAKGGAILSPVVITVDGHDFLLHYPSKAVRLPDGKAVEVNDPVGSGFGSTILTRYDQPHVTFHVGGGEHGGWEKKGQNDTPPPAAVAWSLKGDALHGKVLWSGIEGKRDASHTGMVYDNGKLYLGRQEAILDAQTGKVLKSGKGTLPRTGHLLSLVGDTFIAARESKKGSTTTTLSWKKRDGGGSGQWILDLPKGNKEIINRRTWASMHDTWWFASGGGGLAFDANSIYIRSMEELICIR